MGNTSFNNLPLDAILPSRDGQQSSLPTFEDVPPQADDNTDKSEKKAKGLRVSARPSAAYEERLARLKERTAATVAKAATPSDKSSNIGSQYNDLVLQAALPFISEDLRPVPSSFVRSGLFSVRTGAKREYLNGAAVTSLSNFNIEYRGEELQQDDLSVWMALINMAKDQGISQRVLFSGYSIIKDLAWSMHSTSYDRVKASIERMKVTGIKIVSKDKKAAYSGSLIREFAWDAEDPANPGKTRWMVTFEPGVASLFTEDATSTLHWEVRKLIGTRASIALWLHSFYSSHTEPIPYTVEKLHQLCQSDATLSTFRRNIRQALAKLEQIGFLTDWFIEDDVVRVTKRPIQDLKALLAADSKRRIGKKK